MPRAIPTGSLSQLLASPSTRSWGGWDHPGFDVVASANISVVIPADPYGYEGRSHSLYYCDAHREGSYAWYETASMHSALLQ